MTNLYQKYLGYFVVSLFVTTLAACGGQDSSYDDSSYDDGPSVLMEVSLSSAEGQTNEKSEKNTQADNLIDLNERWQTWAGDVSNVTYDPAQNLLRLPPVVPGQTSLTIAVRRYDQPLTAGTTYTLAVTASKDQAAAVIFLFDQNGNTVAVPGVADGQLGYAQNAKPLSFVAPDSIAGFFIQVQNAWQDTSETTIRARLTGDTDDSNIVGGLNLIDLTGNWPDWDGQESRVSFASDPARLSIAPPAIGDSIALGIRRFSVPLVAGTQYELSLSETSSSGVGMLLFLLDLQGNPVPFTESVESGALGTGAIWLAANPDNPARFVAPDGIGGFIVQVQSPWQATQFTQAVPSLRVVDETLSCKPEFSASTQIVQNEAAGYPFGNELISRDGSTIVFGSDQPLVPEPDGTQLDTDLFVVDVASGSVERLTTGLGGDNRCPCAISADGQIVAFGSRNPNLIAGETDTNGSESDLFWVDRRDGVINRVTPGTGQGGSLSIGSGFGSVHTMSADGRWLAFFGNASELIPGEVSIAATQPDLMLFDTQTSEYTRLTEFGQLASINGLTVSGDGRYVAISSNVSPINNSLNTTGSSVYRIEIATGETVQVGIPGTSVNRPSLSNDGQILVADGLPVLGGSANKYDVFVADLSESNPAFTPITLGQQADSWNIDAFVSGDGNSIAFRQVFGIAPVQARGTVVYDRLTGASTVLPNASFTRSPTLSDDGRVLAYRGSGTTVATVSYPCDER